MALLRNVPATDTLNIAVGEIYNVQTVLSDFQKVEVDQLRTALRSAGPKDTLKKLLNIKFGKLLFLHWAFRARELIVCIEYGPAMIEHMILEANLDPNMKVATDFDSSESKFTFYCSFSMIVYNFDCL